ncbi:hypothetical protein DITRI_Ditri14bG0034200 [Diplodiscus trichospermus]
MTRQVIIRSLPVTRRPPSLLPEDSRVARKRKKFGEVAKGGPMKAELEAELDRIVWKGVRRGGDQDDADERTRAVDMEKEMWGRFYGSGF